MKAPGTAKITPFLPLNRSAMLTLSPGLLSCSSTDGILSPTFNNNSNNNNNNNCNNNNSNGNNNNNNNHTNNKMPLVNYNEVLASQETGSHMK